MLLINRTIRNYALFLLSTIIFFGCAAPGHIKEAASKHLSGECLELFLNGTPNQGYQYQAQSPAAGNPVFAVAKLERGGVVCAKADDFWDLPPQNCKGFNCNHPWEEIEAVALARCEVYLKKVEPNSAARCKIYARGNNIVWDKDVQLKLQ